MKCLSMMIFSLIAVALQAPSQIFGAATPAPASAQAPKTELAEQDCLPEYRFDGKKMVLSEKEWRERLTAEQFLILRKAGTETPYKNAYDNHKEKGIYICAGCALPLFSSNTKFDSHTGWPSYWQPICPKNVTLTEEGLPLRRTEVSCSRCGGHLGHVFNDGPAPTGKRYCMNSASLKFIAK